MNDEARETRVVDALWEALKAECCKNPAEAKTIVFLGEEKFRKALTPILCATTPAVNEEVERRHPMDKHQQQTAHEDNLRWLDEQVAVGWPTEEEAEAILREQGTSGKEVVNDFIDRLLRERQQFKDEADRLRAELNEARAKAIDECANLARMMAAGETYETERQKALNIAIALESLAQGGGENEPTTT